MPAVTLKLSYFDTRGLAEPIRLLLVDKQIAFDDHRILNGPRFRDPRMNSIRHPMCLGKRRDQWVEVKSKMIFGQLPCLLSGDEEIVQSGAILRHLGRCYGLNGSNEAETTFIDMFYEGLRDLHNKYTEMINQNYENGKIPYIEDVLPDELTRLEKLFRTYQNGENFVVGSKESYADYALFEELDIHLILSPTALDRTPVLYKFHQRFAERPNLMKYLNERAFYNIPVNENGKQ